MKRFGICMILLICGWGHALIAEDLAPLVREAEKAQKEGTELRRKAESRFENEKPKDFTAPYRREWQDTVQSLGRLEKNTKQTPITFSKTLMGNEYTRLEGSRQGMEASAKFASGPENIVRLHNGEIVVSATDLAAPTRAGLGFAFTRTYRSHVNYNGPMGFGWDHNHNIRCVANAESFENATQIQLFDGSGVRTFTRSENGWTPGKGTFLKLEFDAKSGKIQILDSNKTTFEFEPYENYWRIQKIVSRIGAGKNSLVYDYDASSGQLKSVTDPFGNTFRFSYDTKGRLKWVQGNEQFVSYEYDFGGCLVSAKIPNVVIDLRVTAAATDRYLWEKTSERYVLKELAPRTGQSVIRFQYTENRVTSAGYYSVKGDASCVWNFRYESSKTFVEPPAPFPAEIVTFNSDVQDASLPVSREIPARKAVWEYAFDGDGLSVRTKTPDGQTLEKTYDSENPDPTLRALVLREATLGNGSNCGNLIESGTRAQYLAGTARLTEKTYYQIDRENVETILGCETYEYEEETLQMKKRVSFGVATRFWYNEQGDLSVQQSADGACTLFFYDAKYIQSTDLAKTSDGQINGAGLCVRVIEDASAQEVRAAARELGISDLQANTRTVNQVTHFIYDTRGQNLGSVVNGRTTVSYKNQLSREIFQYDSQKGPVVFQYNPQFEKVAVFHLLTDSKVAWGEKLPGLTGKFYKETYSYNTLGQVVQYSPTSERSSDGKAPAVWKYERTPSGLILSLTNPLNACRITTYNDCGQVQSVHLEGGNQKSVLSSDYEYTPEGRVLSSRDNHGQRTVTEYSALGTAWKVTTPDGLETITQENGLGKTVSVEKRFAGAVCSRTAMEYDTNARLTKTTELHKYLEKSQTIIVEENRYDNMGRVLASREAQEDSWTTFLYDGLGRRVASRNPVGDIFVTCFESGNPRYQKEIRTNQATGKSVSFGLLTLTDSADHVWLQVPVDAEGGLNENRASVTHLDWSGNTVFEMVPETSTTSKEYDTLGNLRRQTVSPETRNFGEKAVITEFEYDLAGNLISQTTQNNALAIFGTEDVPTPEFVSAPQVLRYSYDALGRCFEEVRPDGLRIQKEFNKSSLVEKTTWQNADKLTLRTLIYRYDSAQRPVEMQDGGGRVLGKTGYDPLGNVCLAVDSSGKHVVTVKRTYDSLGTMRSEEVSYDGQKLPRKDVEVLPESGVQTLHWSGTGVSSPYWRNLQLTSDPAGRMRELELDGHLFCAWKYQGERFVERTLEGSQLRQTRTFNAQNELTQIRISPLATQRTNPRMNLDYVYGPRGEVQSTTTQITDEDGRSQSATQYYSYDSLQNMTGENQDGFIPTDPTARRKEIFELGTEVTSNLTRQIRFDQAGNVWTRFQGMKERTPLRPGSIPEENGASYYSSASIFPKDEVLSPSQLQQLASNRCVTIAEPQAGRDSTSSLKAKQYTYDDLGCLTRYDGTYTAEDGTRTPVRWELKYDILGRLASMEALRRNTDLEDSDGKEGERVALLGFTYDSFNRRLLKEVQAGKEVESRTTATLYDRNHPCLVLERRGDGWQIREQYLWGAESQELLMAVIPQSAAEGLSSNDPKRYYLHQDRGFSVIASTTASGSRIPIVSTPSYLAFGENSSTAKIATINTSGTVSDKEACCDSHFDEPRDTRLTMSDDELQYLEIKLEKPANLTQLRIYSDRKFPARFEVFRIPGEERSPTAATLAQWVEIAKKPGKKWFCCPVEANQSVQLNRPYMIPLGGLRSDRIVLVWKKSDVPSGISIRELCVDIAPDSPGSIAFAGQWCDRETGLYYQLNRYRLPELNGKFISPDPLGFADGMNTYAYAHNNPLSWHDPDGQFGILFGAIGGAIAGGGLYLLDCWQSGEEISWARFGVATLAGTAAGVALVMTCGAVGGGILGSSLGAGAFDATYAMINTTGNELLDGESLGSSLRSGMVSSLEAGIVGCMAGGMAGCGIRMGLFKPVAYDLAYKTAYGIYGAIAGYQQTGTLEGAISGAEYGTTYGKNFGDRISTVLNLVNVFSRSSSSSSLDIAFDVLDCAQDTVQKYVSLRESRDTRDSQRTRDSNPGSYRVQGVFY